MRAWERCGRRGWTTRLDAGDKAGDDAGDETSEAGNDSGDEAELASCGQNVGWRALDKTWGEELVVSLTNVDAGRSSGCKNGALDQRKRWKTLRLQEERRARTASKNGEQVRRARRAATNEHSG
mmetsp:Transcript_44018/g.103725  ORF Transcript_44018/g.103725 Transcript_44018/m.103725 type:complete len:124 (-) Transcript_44018:14-385(-)